MGEDDHPAQDFGYRQMSGETNRPHGYFDLLIADRGIVADARYRGRAVRPWAARWRRASTSTSEVGEKSRYHSPTA